MYLTKQKQNNYILQVKFKKNGLKDLIYMNQKKHNVKLNQKVNFHINSTTIHVGFTGGTCLY